MNTQWLAVSTMRMCYVVQVYPDEVAATKRDMRLARNTYVGGPFDSEKMARDCALRVLLGRLVMRLELGPPVAESDGL